jgi:DNA-binding response OmpR family regulator
VSKTILVVDDDLLLCSLLNTSLIKAGFTCHITHSGHDALDFVANTPPDLVVLDIMMPDMNGFEVARRLRGNPDTEALPIVMLTARLDADSRRAGLLIGVDDFITKPASPDEIVNRINHVIGDD